MAKKTKECTAANVPNTELDKQTDFLDKKIEDCRKASSDRNMVMGEVQIQVRHGCLGQNKVTGRSKTTHWPPNTMGMTEEEKAQAKRDWLIESMKEAEESSKDDPKGCFPNDTIGFTIEVICKAGTIDEPNKYTIRDPNQLGDDKKRVFSPPFVSQKR